MFALIIFIVISKLLNCQIYVQYDSLYVNPDGSESFPFKNLSTALQHQKLLNLSFLLQDSVNPYEFFDTFPENFTIYISCYS